MDFRLPKFPEFSGVLPPNIKIGHRDDADGFYDQISQYIIDFEKTLDKDHEVGGRLVSFGQAFTFHIEDLGYWNPSLITFKGRLEDGSPIQLVQHVSQINVLLTSVKKTSNERQSIGYKLQLEQDKKNASK